MKVLESALAGAVGVLAIAVCADGRWLQSVPWWLLCAALLGIARFRFTGHANRSGLPGRRNVT